MSKNTQQLSGNKPATGENTAHTGNVTDILKIKSWDTATKIIVGLAGGFLVFSVFAPMIFTGASQSLDWDFTATGSIGDTIGGLANPFIGVAGIFVTFLAFYMQVKANELQRSQFKDERDNFKRELKDQADRFFKSQLESQFYEMIRLHRANLEEMEISGRVRGRKCFTCMYEEFKYVYLQLFKILKASKKTSDEDVRRATQLAYKIFLYGMESFERMKSNTAEEIALYKKICPALLEVRQHWDSYVLENENQNAASTSEVLSGKNVPKQSKYVKIAGSNSISIEDMKNEDNSKFAFEIFYYPFFGQSRKLGHYYRLLFQAVSLIVDNDQLVDNGADETTDAVISEKRVLDRIQAKKRYLKLLRAQLSNHEQLLLYYNGLSEVGTGWLDKKYFSTYQMIKNIPLELADFGVRPETQFAKEITEGQHLFG